MSKNITAVSKVVTQEALETVAQKLKDNIWAIPSRSSPNAAKLKDGAIQRASVAPDFDNLHVKQNPDMVGYYKRSELNEKASRTAYIHSNIWDNAPHRDRVARIYQPQKKHVHNVPSFKNIGKYWVIEFESWGTYKSPLMGWTSGTEDQMTKVRYQTQTLTSAVDLAVSMGWGVDVQYPRNRWHMKKNYSDNFTWKGNPKEEPEYD